MKRAEPANEADEELAYTAARAMAIWVLAQSGFTIPQSNQHLVSAGNRIHSLFEERIELINIEFPSHRNWRFAEAVTERFVESFAQQNYSRVLSVVTRNPLVALQVAEICKVDYHPFIDEMPPTKNPEESIPRAAHEIRSSLRIRSLNIPQLILVPSEADSDEVAVLFALLVAYLFKDESLSTFKADLTERYELLGGQIPTRQPLGILRDPENIEDVISYWLPHALFTHAIAQRPVDLIIESLIEVELILYIRTPFVSRWNQRTTG